MFNSWTEKFNDRTWRILTNFWSFATMGFFILNFFTGDKYNTSSTAIAIIYIATLGIYAGTKEFDRWQNHHWSRRKGELFIISWTILILAFAVIALFSGGKYRMPSEFPATYIALLSIFALTQRSKFMHNKNKRERENIK